MPPSGGSHSFEARLEALPAIVHQPQLEPGGTSPTSQTMLIVDELLVASSYAAKVQAYLKAHNVRFARLTTLLQGLKFPLGVTRPNDDVEVWKLLPPHPPVTALVQGMWAGPLAAKKRAVTPNHVLVPAGWADQCPLGPPTISPVKASLLPHHGHAHGAEITVIDSGYQWNPTWGGAPLDRLVKLIPHKAQHSTKKDPTTTLTPVVGDVRNAVLQGKWADDSDDGPDANGNGRLDALAGHANFVTGVLGQYTDFPIVNLWNHFGGYYPDPDEYTRELAVCRSLLKSHIATQNPLINLGFAFVPLKDRTRQDVLSIAWDLVFQTLGTSIPPKVLVVTPAGNQGTTAKRYPGALNARYPGQYPNVIAVGSHDAGKVTPSRDVTGAPWSNYGDWITCSAIGSEVDSTFLHVSMATEDDTAPWPYRDFTPNDSARWSGTCFAAPKVTALIAEQHATTGSLATSFANVLATFNAQIGRAHV